MLASLLRKGLSYASAFVWILALLCALAQPARAYVDPGSGLLAFQVTGSLLTGFLFLLRQRIRRLFCRTRRRDGGAENRPDSELDPQREPGSAESAARDGSG